MTYEEARKEAEQILKGAEVPDAALDAWYLLEYAIRKIEKKETGRTWYLMNRKESILPGTLLYYQELVSRRKQRIPLQHLTGEQEFYGYPFYVNEHVLIPRQDTEVLVEEALKRKKEGMKVLDLCTGSGCILLSILKNLKQGTGVGIDISEQALEVARRNAKRLGLEAATTFVLSDLFEKAQGPYDMIVSNPPYVDEEDLADMPEEFHYEPELALGSGVDGLEITKQILKQAPDYLTPNGMLVCEVGNSMVSLIEQYPDVPFEWVELKNGGLGVFAISREDLVKYHDSF